MSSGTPVDVGQARDIVRATPLEDGNSYGEEIGPEEGTSARQHLLDWFWKFYRCQTYDEYKVAWDGGPTTPAHEHISIARSQYIPPGFYDAGGDLLPIRFRRPCVEYYLARPVVARFTGLLFSKKRHPTFVSSDPDTADWANAFAKKTKLWVKAISMRNFGGGMGSVAIGFKFAHGEPQIEIHDARWCTPKFVDGDDSKVKSMVKRYMFTEQVRDPEGKWEAKHFWYRRRIDAQVDIVWPKVPVGDGEPDWDKARKQIVTHDFGECPVVWIQNEPVEDETDGDPDCHGIYSIIMEIDQLLSQASLGTKASCDPTVAVASDAEFEEIKKGTGNAVQVEKGGSIDYMEMSGSGIDRAQKLADDLENKALTIVRCVLESKMDSNPRTATEIERTYSGMLERADVFREQYGEMGLKPLMEMVLRIARRMTEPKIKQINGVSTVVKTEIKLPKRRVLDPASGVEKVSERKLGDAEEVDLKWPAYFTPGLESVSTAVTATAAAKAADLIDDRNAAEYLAPYLDIEDVDGMLEAVEERREANKAEMNEKFIEGATAPADDKPKNPFEAKDKDDKANDKRPLIARGRG